MGLLSKESEYFDVKHVKDVIEVWEYWNEHDSAPGAGEWIKRGRLVKIYESKDVIFKTDGKGMLISTEFKND